METGREAELVELARRGDETAFLALFRLHRDAVFRFAYRLCGCPQTAEDIAQDCFVGLLRASGRFDNGRGSLRNYLYGAARNLAWKRLGRATEVGLSATAGAAAPTPGPEQALLNRELAEAVRRAVAALPLAQREALVLFEYEELSLEEAALVLGIDAGAVKSRLHRARENLRKLLAPYAQAKERS